MRQLLLDCLLIVAESLLIEQFALLTFHRGVAYHAGGTAYQCYGAVARILEMLENHHTDKVSYMKAVGSGVDTQICRGHAFGKFFGGSGHYGVHHSAPAEFFYKIFHRYCNIKNGDRPTRSEFGECYRQQ